MSLAVRPTLIEITLTHWTQVRESQQGQLLFWAGSTGSGRRATLDALAAAVSKDKSVHVLKASFHKSESPSESLRQNILELYGTDIFITAASTIHPLAGLVAQLFAGAGPTKEMLNAWRIQGAPTLEQDPLVFRQALLRAGQQKPILCLLSHCDEAPAQWGSFWITFMGELSQLPVLLVLTLDAPTSLPEPTPADTDIWKVAYYLCGQGKAQWYPMPPVNRDDVSTYTGPADEAVTEQLWRITKGNPRWIEFLWQAWRADMVVEQRGTGFLGRGQKVWHFVTDYQDKSFHPVEHILGQRLSGLKLSQAQQLVLRDVLSVGALQGQSFAAPVVIAILHEDHKERQFHPYNLASDDIINLLDEYLVVDGTLLEEIPTPGHPTGLWRYRFTSELVWLTFARYGISDLQQVKLSGRLAERLNQAYYPNPRPIAPILARLYKHANNIHRAEYYRHLADVPHSRHAKLAHCRVLQTEGARLLELSTWDRWEQMYSKRLLKQLLEESIDLLQNVSPRYLLSFFDGAFALAQRGNEKKYEANALYYKGRCLSDLGDKSQALIYFEQALQIQKSESDAAGTANSLHDIGRTWADLGEPRKALTFLEEALQLRRVTGNRGGEANTLNSMGRVWANLGERRKGMEYFEQSLRLRRATGDRSGEANTLQNIGALWSAFGEMTKGLEYCQEALNLHRTAGNLGGEAKILMNIGTIWSKNGDSAKALTYHEASLSLFRALEDRSGEAGALTHISAVWAAAGERQAALSYLEQALPLRRVVGDRSGEAYTLQGMGVICSDLGQQEKGLAYLEQALLLQRAVLNRVGEAEILINIGIVWSKAGEKTRALEVIQQALTLYRTLGDHPGEALARRILNDIRD
jgi:tetratricopeptide (TPR) repeat protein